ncbi:hypothetical protein BC830DRAFT_1154308 [Chytriomyces sp. MP71]|nr:hypothetical protein BC830DRAFT_1154308 [Chytriomyces sp. MP71]
MTASVNNSSESHPVPMQALCLCFNCRFTNATNLNPSKLSANTSKGRIQLQINQWIHESRIAFSTLAVAALNGQDMLQSVLVASVCEACLFQDTARAPQITGVCVRNLLDMQLSCHQNLLQFQQEHAESYARKGIKGMIPVLVVLRIGALNRVFCVGLPSIFNRCSHIIFDEAKLLAAMNEGVIVKEGQEIEFLCGQLHF